MRQKSVLILLVLAVLALFSCRKETVASWDVDITGPVVSSKLNIRHFLTDSLFTTDANGILNLNINREVAYIKVDSLLKLPDTTIVNSFTTPITLTLTPGQSMNLLPPTPLTFSLGDGIALKYAIIRTGNLKIKYSNTVSEPLSFLYILPGVKKYGQPLIISETIPPGNNSLVKTYPLNGYDIDLTAGGAANYNTITQSYTVSLSQTANTVVANPGTGAKIELSYSDIIPQYAKGYFGMQSVPVNIDTARLDIFKNFNAINFQLSDATLDFRIINEFGAEFNGLLSNIKSLNTINQSSITLNTQQLSSININRAFEANNTVNPTIKLISLNKNNSNILPFISNLPDKLTYSGNINLNPLGNTSGFNDFAYYNTGIRVLADINIPMKFMADAFILQTVSPIDFSTLKQLDNVNYGSFIISAKNGYPFDAVLQAYLVNDQNVVIDSLFVPGNNIIVKGITNTQHVVIAPSYQRINMPFDNAKLQNIKKSKSIKLKARLNMPIPQPPEISLKDTYEIDIDIIIDVNYKVKRK
ncbi:MAG: hypothetical protein SGJ15_03615 [Bacteroidota bacterium]|nr:hypothetical protein [Bacteroidota bacterium]